MIVPKLLQRTVARYEAAVQSVLQQWSPPCGCDRPGAEWRCEACPCLAVFEQRVQEQIRCSLNPAPTQDN